MATENIQDLLILQDRYATAQQLRVEIDRLPGEIQKLEQKIKEEKAVAAAAEQSVKALEVKRSEVELEVQAAEEQIAKYKNQQLLVKKNEEYRALTHEIELFEGKIGDLETVELEVMEAIDYANEHLKAVEADVAKKTKYQEDLIEECHAKLENLRSRIGDAEAAFEAQSAKMDPKEVSLFQMLTTQIRRAPYLAEMKEHTCGGCHMRVSNDVFKKAKIGEVARCDQCARIVYFVG